MFTGIVEETGRVQSHLPGPRAIELRLLSRLCARGLKPGDSLALNGCCLTVEKILPAGPDKSIQFSVLQETWRLTNLQFARPGDPINLERALLVGGRMGGHFVTGHVDGLGKIRRWESSGRDYILEVAASPSLMRHIVLKGSIAVDGISLTIAAVRKNSFDIWIIPHTRDVTALRQRKKGDAVNLETDLLAKLVARLLPGK